MSAVKVTILGCGGSTGVPRIDGWWGNCDPENPKNRRRRSSVMVEFDGKRIVIDTGPDFRDQILGVGFKPIDAVFYSHLHFDHIGGLDELRPVSWLQEGPIDIYAGPRTMDSLVKRAPYALEDTGSKYYKPFLIQHLIEGAYKIGDMPITPIDVDHGGVECYGFRFGDAFAYTTDVSALPEHSFEVIEGVDTWVVAALRHDPHPTHAHLDSILGYIERVKPRRAILTHMTAFLDYETLKSQLPQGVEPAYDGMVLEIVDTKKER